VLLAAGCGHRAADPPRLVLWSRIGDIALGEPRARVEHEYGRARDFYRLHGGKVTVTYFRGRVDSIDFTTRYYRTKSGFGIGSRIPRGGHWHGFVWNVRLREFPCSCWTKVGRGARSLPVTGANFLKPWTIVFVEHGRVREIYFTSRYVD
jgi:hypothetical protein